MFNNVYTGNDLAKYLSHFKGYEMSIIDKIKADQLSARKSPELSKDGVTVSLLTTLMSAIITEAKDAQREATDTDCIAKIRSFLKSNKELSEALSKAQTVDQAAISIANKEAEILNSYLPKQLTSDEILAHVKTAISNGIKDIGGVMAHLKKNFAGLYDGGVAKKHIDSEISKL